MFMQRLFITMLYTPDTFIWNMFNFAYNMLD